MASFSFDHAVDKDVKIVSLAVERLVFIVSHLVVTSDLMLAPVVDIEVFKLFQTVDKELSILLPAVLRLV